MENYIKLYMIGKGSGGNCVYKVKSLLNKEEYAMKRILIDINEEKERNTYFNEIEVFKRLHHCNLIKYQESFIHKNKLCIIMEYANQGDLNLLIEKYKKEKKYIPENEIWYIIIQIYRAIEYLHSKKIIHRDIKCQNIFLSGNEKINQKIIKLGDFGISKILKCTYELCKTPLGTPYYLSPEICSGKEYDYKSDVWMFGCVIYELMTLEKPFEGINLPNLIMNILKKEIKNLPCIYSKELIFLCKKLLTKDVKNRPYIWELKNYDFFKKKNDSFKTISVIRDNMNINKVQNYNNKINKLFKIKLNNFPIVESEIENEEDNERLSTVKEDDNIKSLEKNKQNFLNGKLSLLQEIEKKKKKRIQKHFSDSNLNSKNEKIKHSRNKSNVNLMIKVYKKKLIKDYYNNYKRCISDFPLSSKKNIKSAPPISFKESNTLYARIKNTPRKYLISFESENLEKDNFIIENYV